MKRESFFGILMVGLMMAMVNTKVIEATPYVSGTQTGTWDLTGSPYSLIPPIIPFKSINFFPKIQFSS